MEKRIHFCWNCLYYKAYYTKELCRFDKLDFGQCCKHQVKICEKSGFCDSWHSNYKRHSSRVACAMRSVKQAAESLAVLKQIFEEEIKEE